jgi:hypothetical protein
MPEAEHINTTAAIVDTVEDQIRGANELFHSRATPDVAAAFRKLRESFRSVEQRHSQSLRSLHLFFGNVPNDGFEIVQRQRLEVTLMSIERRGDAPLQCQHLYPRRRS